MSPIFTTLAPDLFEAAAKHKGVAFIEVMLNCVIFNDGAYTQITGKEHRSTNSVRLAQGKPLIFGKNLDCGVKLGTEGPEVVNFEPGKPPSDLLVHDMHSEDSGRAYTLSLMEQPWALGIFRQVEAPVYEEKFQTQAPVDDMQKFLAGSDAWTEGEC